MGVKVFNTTTKFFLAAPIPPPGLKYHRHKFLHHQFNLSSPKLFFTCKFGFLYDTMGSMHVGQVFEISAAFKEALRNWAIVDYFEYRWAFSDSQRCKAVCVRRDCTFTVRCNAYPAKECAKVTILVQITPVLVVHLLLELKLVDWISLSKWFQLYSK